MNKQTIRDAAATVGGMSKLSRLLGLSPAAVGLWEQVPPKRVLEVERLTGVSRHVLRPDIYGPAVETAEKAA